MIVYMSGIKHPEVDEEELKFYGYEKCEDYCHTYCSYYRFGKCYKCAFYKDYGRHNGLLKALEIIDKYADGRE